MSDQESRLLDPGDLLIRRYDSTEYDIVLVTHVRDRPTAECISISSVTHDLHLSVKFFRDRSGQEYDEIVYADSE